MSFNSSSTSPSIASASLSACLKKFAGPNPATLVRAKHASEENDGLEHVGKYLERLKSGMIRPSGHLNISSKLLDHQPNRPYHTKGMRRLV